MCSLLSAEEKEKELEKKRTVKLQEWNVKLQALQTLLSEQENAFKLREGIAADLETVKFKKSEIEVEFRLNIHNCRSNICFLFVAV